MILLTGATGYIGGRLLAALEARGERVRCLARSPERLRGRVAAGTEVVAGDVLDAASLHAALAGAEVAYYLVHAMGSAGSFLEEERRGAEIFARAAREARVGRIVYLGGLGGGEGLSDHLRSRQEVGRILRASGVPTLELRASIIIGSGSLSWEMARSLVQKLPVMLTPRWVDTLTQPIAVEDVIAYLLEAARVPLPESRVVEIGGADRVSYGDIMALYAKRRGLRRLVLRVPVLSPRLSSLWLGLVTPLYARVGRKLIDGVRNETVVRDDAALRLFSVRPRGAAEAIDRALIHEDREFAATRWSDAFSSAGEARGYGGRAFGRRLVDSRAVRASVPPERAFEPIRRIGGEVGWYAHDWLWRIRGFVDLLAGGVGMRRGRAHPRDLHPGDAVDFWRVEAFEPPRLLRLAAEMKLPGRAWLQFEADPAPEGGATIRQTAVFEPLGLAGLLYWYGIYPLHALVFRAMIRALARAAERVR